MLLICVVVRADRPEAPIDVISVQVKEADKWEINKFILEIYSYTY